VGSEDGIFEVGTADGFAVGAKVGLEDDASKVVGSILGASDVTMPVNDVEGSLVGANNSVDDVEGSRVGANDSVDDVEGSRVGASDVEGSTVGAFESSVAGESVGLCETGTSRLHTLCLKASVIFLSASVSLFSHN